MKVDAEQEGRETADSEGQEKLLVVNRSIRGRKVRKNKEKREKKLLVVNGIVRKGIK